MAEYPERRKKGIIILGGRSLRGLRGYDIERGKAPFMALSQFWSPVWGKMVFDGNVQFVRLKA